jgi:hypothetical protein
LVLHLTRTPGWQARIFQAIEQWPRHMELWQQWHAIYQDYQDPEHKAKALAFYLQNQARMHQGAEVLLFLVVPVIFSVGTCYFCQWRTPPTKEYMPSMYREVDFPVLPKSRAARRAQQEDEQQWRNSKGFWSLGSECLPWP